MKKSFLFISLFLCVVFGMNLPASTNTKLTLPAVNPRENATISYTFDGMMAMCFGDPTRVSIGLLNVEHHKPEVRIIRVQGEQKQTMAVLKGADLQGNIYFDVEGNSQPNIIRYQASSQENDPNDFRWTVDMESDLFQKQLYIKEEGIIAKLRLSAGLFYGHNLSDEKYRFFASDNSGKVLPFNRRMAEPAAKLNLNIGDTLVIKLAGKTLRLTADSGVRYEIAINNLPPDEMASMDHWVYYYDFIGANVTRYTPVVMQKSVFGPRPLWCEAAVFSRSQLN